MFKTVSLQTRTAGLAVCSLCHGYLNTPSVSSGSREIRDADEIRETVCVRFGPHFTVHKVHLVTRDAVVPAGDAFGALDTSPRRSAEGLHGAQHLVSGKSSPKRHCLLGRGTTVKEGTATISSRKQDYRILHIKINHT